MTYKGIISNIKPDSIGAELGLVPGDRLLAVNGEPVQDIIDLSFALAEEEIELLVERVSGEQEVIAFEKDYDEELGLEFESAVFDKVRHCANKCIFCFVDQMPSGLRESLYVKDDDYRLSFLYGNFITLTNLNTHDLSRIARLHLSPLYISVHTTNSELRKQMLNNKQAGIIMDQLKQLTDYGIELHTQIVLCPGFNDGKELEKTIQDLYSLRPSVLSLAIVPVGLTRFRDNCEPLDKFSASAAGEVIELVHKWQEKSRRDSGESFVYLADEFYLSASKEIPSYEFYDGFPQLENGIGLIRSFLADWEQAEVPISGYSETHYIDVVCGVSAEKILAPLLADFHVPNLVIRVIAAPNNFFGKNITVTGLLTGGDIISVLQKLPGKRSGIIIPGVALRKGEQVFLDDMTPGEIAAKLEVPVRTAYFAQDLKQLLAAWR
ncbi:MAG: putative radical enzyme [Firmicutes bacterium]|nr:putative radical enzyme [Bacillota bacterium]